MSVILTFFAVLFLAFGCNDSAASSEPSKSAHLLDPAAIRARAGASALERLSKSQSFSIVSPNLANDCADVSLVPNVPGRIAKKCRGILLAASKARVELADAAAASRFLNAAKALGATGHMSDQLSERIATLRRRARAKSAHDDLGLFIESYGPPDEQDSTENDNPRPPIVTRWIIYRKEHVRATYLPDAHIGDAPPYDRWKLIGFQDSRTDQVLHPAEVARRLSNRER